ncbi:hypothetical protein FA10DRAFT_68082 [Acaromyces ingoldii]|uniref:Uncharacterized protein n=1 Tax=Acaromyces ingoldii TaxID=215250 RepID=A0A316YQA2_9BASI|nr:hypothetical protein FA10DRAFT_68082 [Acaromyces ingoldii]PWN91469.1 hypothetical protein FA10DRAFT_68082 [Acaromyces ingoldii]
MLWYSPFLIPSPPVSDAISSLIALCHSSTGTTRFQVHHIRIAAALHDGEGTKVRNNRKRREKEGVREERERQWKGGGRREEANRRRNHDAGGNVGIIGHPLIMGQRDCRYDGGSVYLSKRWFCDPPAFRNVLLPRYPARLFAYSLLLLAPDGASQRDMAGRSRELFFRKRSRLVGGVG